MRYRPFGASGKAVSAISLLLREAPNMTTPHAWRTLVFSAMESGVNCFEITAGSEIMALGFGEALRAVERRLIAIGWRIHGDPRKVLTAEAISNSVRGGLARTGAGYFDVLMLDEAAFETLAPDAQGYLADLRAAGLVLQMGVVGDGDSIDACLESGLFDVLATPFSLVSDWKARRRIKDASARDMTMIAYNTSKAAVINFTRTLAGEWGKHNINVNALAPGFFPSRMTQATLAQYGADNMARHAPLLRLGDDDDLKGAPLLFASRAGKHITGQTLAVDGGVSTVIGAA